MAFSDTDTAPWIFVSSPDWFNQDVADLSGATDGIPAAPGWANGVSGGINGVTPEALAVYNSVLNEMASYQPQAFLVAGDLINGRWFDEATLDMFDPATRDRVTAIQNASRIYYGWYRKLFADAGLPLVLGALGDHEIGDDPWPANSEKTLHIATMKQAFHQHIIEPLALPESINGVTSHPIGTGYDHSAYAYRLNNVLFVSVDVFRYEGSSTLLDIQNGTVRAEVSSAQLAWLEAILQSADADPAIDHVIVQGHAPVLSPVRIYQSSGIQLADRENSAFWQTLQAHNHRNGGKVRLYLAGEVHTVTTLKDQASDLVQIAHGSPPRGNSNLQKSFTNFVVFTVTPQRIEASLRWIELTPDPQNISWQVDQPATVNPITAAPSEDAGALTIDTNGAESIVTTSGLLQSVDMNGLAVHFGFDQFTSDGNFVNSGDIADLHYNGVKVGGVQIVPGVFGNAIQLDGSSGYVESGRGNLNEGESRTVAAWVQTTATVAQNILSYGSNASGLNGRFEFLLSSGRLQLRISSSQVCLPGSMPVLNDGRWRHVAVVLPKAFDNRCSDVLFFRDGVRYSAVTNNAAIHTLPWATYKIGVNKGGNGQYFKGKVDDVSIWSAPLSSAKVKAVAGAGVHVDLGYNAPTMQALFKLFDEQGPSTTIAGSQWQYTTGLLGAAGEITAVNGMIAIILDASGNGLLSDISITTPTTVFNQSSASDGLVVVEAEHATGNTPQGVHQWTQVLASSYAGGAAMQGLPNSNVTFNSGYATTSPRLDFEVNFVKTGKHFVWVRGAAATTADASLHVGLDGVETASADRMHGYTPTPSWRKSTLDGNRASIQISTPGRHTLNVWMRQDGIVVDRVLLTKNWEYVPVGQGPVESPR